MTYPKNDKATNHLFADHYSYYGDFRLPTGITVVNYNRSSVSEQDVPTDSRNFRAFAKDDSINWFRIKGLSDNIAITRMISEFGFAPVDAKAVFTPYHAAKVDNQGGRVQIVMDCCIFEKKGHVSSEHICILYRGNTIFTFRERNRNNLDPVAEHIRSNTMDLRNSPPALLIAFIINALLSETIGTAMRVEQMLEHLDDILLDPHHDSRHVARNIQHCRHANLIIQKNSRPLKSEFHKLLDSDLATSDDNMTLVYNELYNQLDFIVLTSVNSKELLASMRDLYVSNNDLKMNEVMKRLTVVSTLFIPITFIVGLWGMNFRIMPETEWAYGYILAICVLAITAFITWYYMKKNGWFR